MEKIRVAFATDNGETFMKRHFGDAKFYYIYDLINGKAEFIKKITNTTEEEADIHADPLKAKGISKLLFNENVTVVISKVFGPNITRIKKKFVCIFVKDDKIDVCIKKVNTNIDIILAEWKKGSERGYLNL